MEAGENTVGLRATGGAGSQPLPRAHPCPDAQDSWMERTVDLLRLLCFNSPVLF